VTMLQPDAWTALTIVGLAVVTVVTRGFFLYARREPRIPEPLLRALQVAPLAAIVAVLAPEIFMTHGHLVETWRDARLPAALAATLFYLWRRGVLGPLIAGLVVYLPLHLAWGW
jgi:branched-subunit amino acid transport protein